MEMIRFLLCAALILVGLMVLLSAAVGNLRLPGALPRMHSIAMGDSVGTLCLMMGLLLGNWDTLAKMKLLGILAFFWMSGPVCSHLLCKFEVEEEEED